MLARNASLRGMLVLCTVCLMASRVMGEQVSIETFTGAWTASCTIPGISDPPNVDFSCSVIVDSVSFTPGAVTFLGNPVDFDGTEADWIASTYSGTVSVQNLPGQSVSATASGSVSGAASINAEATTANLSLGAGFSTNALDLVPSSTFSNSSATVGSWNSTVVPELNGATVTTSSSITLTSVDAVLGLVSADSTGTIFAFAGEKIPAVSTWGLVLLLIGAVGLGTMVFRTKRGSPRTSAG